MTPLRKIGITCYPTYGGSGVVATELGIELAARGHEVHFITSSPPFRLNGREANIHFHEVDVYHYPLFEHPPYDLALAARMAAGASLRRHVDPADVAEAVVFLAGPGARNITGVELPVTAGR